MQAGRIDPSPTLTCHSRETNTSRVFGSLARSLPPPLVLFDPPRFGQAFLQPITCRPVRDYDFFLILTLLLPTRRTTCPSRFRSASAFSPVSIHWNRLWRSFAITQLCLLLPHTFRIQILTHSLGCLAVSIDGSSQHFPHTPSYIAVLHRCPTSLSYIAVSCSTPFRCPR